MESNGKNKDSMVLNIIDDMLFILVIILIIIFVITVCYLILKILKSNVIIGISIIAFIITLKGLFQD